MRHLLGILSAIVVLCPALASAQGRRAANTQMGLLEQIDPRLEKLVPKGTTMEVLHSGLDWSEGPVWLKKESALLFSDVPQNRVYLLRGDGPAEIYLSPSGYTNGPDRGDETGSNGLVLDPEGNLVLMQHGDRRVARLGKDRQFITLADRFEGKRLNSPNDGVYKSNGDLYFTDPPYGLVGKNGDPAKEIPFNGVYRLAKDGKLTLVTKEMTYPNGIAFSPDERRFTSPTPTRRRRSGWLFRSSKTEQLEKGRSSSMPLHWSASVRACPTASKWTETATSSRAARAEF